MVDEHIILETVIEVMPATEVKVVLEVEPTLVFEVVEVMVNVVV